MVRQRSVRQIFYRVIGPTLLVILAFGLAGGARARVKADDKLRTWKDSTGSFEIEAAFVNEKNGVVTLRQENGDEMEIELGKLSAADQAFAKTQKAQANNPFKKKGESSPFRPKKGDAPADASERPTSSGQAAKTVKAKWNKAKHVQPASKSDWASIVIEPLDGSKIVDAVQLPQKRDFFEKLTGFVASPTLGIVGYKLERPGDRDNVSTRLVSANLETGDQGDVVIDGNFALLDVFPADGLILVKQDVWGFGNQAEFQIWKAASGGIEPVVSCVPFESEDGPAKDISTAKFVDANHVLVMNGRGKIGQVDLTSGNVGYLVECTNPYAMQLSPDRKFLAVVTGKELHVINAATGKAVAGMEIGSASVPQLAFSTDGKRLAMQTSESVTSWNLADGSLYRDVVLSGLPFNSSTPPVWTSERHVLVGGSFLIDLENYVRLWQFDGAETVVTVGSTTLFCVNDHSKAGAIVPMVLPQERAQEALQAALADRNFFVIQPGASVRVDVSGISDAAAQQAAKKSLAEKLVASGMLVSDSAATILKASVENLGSEEQSYRSFGGGFGETKVNVTKWGSKVALLVDGQPVWETQMVATPGFVNREKNESIEQAVQRNNTPNFGFFEAVGIPKYVMRPGAGKGLTLGASQVTANGLR